MSTKKASDNRLSLREREAIKQAYKETTSLSQYVMGMTYRR